MVIVDTQFEPKCDWDVFEYTPKLFFSANYTGTKFCDLKIKYKKWPLIVSIMLGCVDIIALVAVIIILSVKLAKKNKKNRKEN